MRFTEPVVGPASDDGSGSTLDRASARLGPDVSRFGYHPALDGIRAIAVLAVIAYHDNYGWARGGFLGVDAFFVLSGFLITALLLLEFRRANGVALGSFWGRRARRLLPALLVVLLFVAWYTQRYVVPWERTSIRDDGIASLFYYANWRFIVDQQSYFTLFSAASPLRHTWSLAIEEQFYLVWPLVVLACLRIGRGSVKVLAIVSGLGTVASILAMATLYRDGDPSRAYYGTDARAHTLLVGALLAMLLVSWRPSSTVRRLVTGLGPVALATMVAFWARLGDTDPLFYRGGSIVFALVVALLIAAVTSGGWARTVLSLKPLPWIGRISYGLYLWHWPITVWIVPNRVHVSNLTLNLMRLGLTFMAATLSFYLIEKPIRVGWSRRPEPIAWLAPIGLTLTLVAVLASTAGATPPPSYLWGYGDPLFCGTPRAKESNEARAAYLAEAPRPIPRRVRDQRILLVGDSTACSLWAGMRQVGKVNHMTISQASVFGCGVASGQITTTRNEQITPHSERCDQMVDQVMRERLPKAKPQLVIWMSVWEKSDLVENGRTLVSGTKAGDEAMQARMDAALRRLTLGNARVVLVNVAPAAPNDAEGTKQTSNAIDDASYLRLASINRRFARRHPDRVTLVDFAPELCPGGPPCPALIDGERVRPDGRHFSPAAAAHYSDWLLRRIAETQR